MSEDRRRRVADSALTLVDNLEEYAIEEASSETEAQAPIVGSNMLKPADTSAPPVPDGTGKTVLCAGGRGELDNAAMAMLAQVLTLRGAKIWTIDHSALNPSRIKNLDVADVDAVLIGYLNSKSVTHARYVVRRLKRARRSLRVGIVFWAPAEDALSDIKLGATIGCDFISRSMRDAVPSALSSEKTTATDSVQMKISTRKAKPRATKRQNA
jgi:hypothetical protein